MNIWIFNHYAVSPNLPGGTRHFDFARELVIKGHQVIIYASSFHYTLRKESKVYNGKSYIIEDVEGVKFIWIKTFPYQKNNWRRLLNMLSYYWKVNRVAKNIDLDLPDIIIGSTVHPFAPLVASKLSKRFNAPFIFEIRDLWPQTMIDMGVWGKMDPRSVVFKLIEAKTVKNAKAIIILSPLTENYLNEKYNYRKIYYLPNGVTLKSFDNRQKIYQSEVNKNETLKKLYSLKKDNKFIIMFTGSIVISYSLDLIIYATEKLKNSDIYIVIVGDGQERHNYLKLMKKLNLVNILILKPVRKELVPVLLSFGDVLLLIFGRVLWGSSNKLFEYLAARKPIITAVPVKHNNPIEHVDCGYAVPTLQPAALVDAFEKLYKITDKERERMGRAGRNYVEKNHSISMLAEKFEKFLMEVKRNHIKLNGD